MKRSSHYGAEESVITMILPEHMEDQSWATTQPDRLDAVGLADIKHVELYDKWRPLTPSHRPLPNTLTEDPINLLLIRMLVSSTSRVFLSW